ncbi:MAG: hypothetical protein ACHP85_13920 [Burkholderiales bacterium]
MRVVKVSLVVVLLAGSGAMRAAAETPVSALPAADCCRHEELAEKYGVIWTGMSQTMTIERLAAYAAPVLWFSPDEPLLKLHRRQGSARGKEILIPEPFPFEADPGVPVAYYRVRRILQRIDEPGAGTYVVDSDLRGNSLIDLGKIVGIDLDFFFYYSKDFGGGTHVHDVESVETRIAVARSPGCQDCPWVLGLVRATGKAHGIQWYDNTLTVDGSTILPVHILVEEGKHASCTDRNADGYYTPGFDVTERVNDAWGVRDTLGSGTFFTGHYQSWMTKVRSEETRVFPPLPEDSPLRESLSREGEYAPDNAVYVLRPYPGPEHAAPDLKPYIADKGDPNWPQLVDTDLERFERWLADESFAKSWALSFRADGDLGLSLAFPLLIVKNVQDPLAGGWLVNRVYLKDTKLRDFGWLLHYAKSASRWVDGYFALGWEHDVVDVAEGGTRARNVFVTETGVKLRVNIHHTPLKLLAKLGTDFWGLRVGIRTVDLWDFDQIGYVIEFGAGSW